ncbi:MAG: ribonuclease H-like domain-containing protein, partial [Candidatus Zixiibacteriota bacterium]
SGIIGDSQPGPQTGLPERYQLMADSLGGDMVSTSTGSFCLVHTNFPCDGIADSRPLVGNGEYDRESLPVTAFTVEHEPGVMPVSSLVFVDTETTGLGGVGTVAFLIGCGSVVDGQFEVRQYIIPDYADEAAMLEALQEEFGEGKVLVTYNGAAFDLPVLRDRMIVNRVARDIAMSRHIDLLHPVRRLFRRRLKDCTLVNVERELLRFERSDDIPGYLIPSLYFEWLSEQNLELMHTVLRHNRRDVVSLYYVTVLIAQAYETQGATLEAVDDIYSLSRLFGRRREHLTVTRLYERLDESAEGHLDADVLLFHAQAFKRAGRYEKAVELWERLAGRSSREAYQANIELAIHYEHRVRDAAVARHHARQAQRIGPTSAKQAEALRHRIARLQGKLRKP